MTNPSKPNAIGVYGIIRSVSNEAMWQHLPATSQDLTDIQFIPSAGDWITTAKQDWPLLGLDAEKPDYRCLLVVQHRVTNYGGVDVAIICQFPDDHTAIKPPEGWQKIPLN